MSETRFCNYCQRYTETIDEDCTVCKFSKPVWDEARKQVEADDKKRIEELAERMKWERKFKL